MVPAGFSPAFVGADGGVTAAGAGFGICMDGPPSLLRNGGSSSTPACANACMTPKNLGGGGVAVAEVSEDSFAEEVGMEAGDVIISINRVPVNSIEDIRKVQSTLKPGDAVAFRVARIPQPAVRGGPSGAAQTFYLAGTLPKN